jgi:predicted RNA-binding Zn-ribbon protein involved in translation (DUF1610 family)
MPPSAADAPTARRPTGRPKNTLFCPDCGHESPSDGDWRLRTTAAGDAYDCPDCRTTITVRPWGRDRTLPRAAFAPVSLALEWLARLWTPGRRRPRGSPDR